jgi:hypothetical protein
MMTYTDVFSCSACSYMVVFLLNTLLLLLHNTSDTTHTHTQEKCIRLLFTTKDLSQVKAYCWRQWTKVLANRAGIADFIFQKVS